MSKSHPSPLAASLSSGRKPHPGKTLPKLARLGQWGLSGAVACAAFDAAAEGFRNPPAGTFGLGRSGGRFAQIDDVTAITHNPANLVELKETSFSFEPTLVYIKADYESPTGAKAETRDPWKLLPSFFAATPFADGRFAAGLAITSPYGLSNEWKQDGAFAGPFGPLHYTTPYYSELKTINANPTFSAKLGERVSIGVGLDVTWSEVTFKQFYPWVLFPGGAGVDPDGIAKVKGDGTGFGGNVGLTWHLTDRQRVAVTYRSPIKVDYDGSFRVSNVPGRAAAFGISSRTPMETAIEFPTIVGGGYGIQLTDTVRVEANAEWLQFSNFDSLDLDIGANNILLPSTSIPENWKDTFTAGVGGDWKFAPDWVLRASYQFYQSPVPDSTLSPTIPDADQQVFTAGIGYKHKRHSAELAYGGIFYADRHIQNSTVNAAFNADYHIMVHLFSFGYRYSF